MSIKRIKYLKINCIHFLSILLLVKATCGGGKRGRKTKSVCCGKFYAMAVQKWRHIFLLFFLFFKRFILVKMSKMPKGLPCAEWTMPSVCVRSDLVCINYYLGGRILSLSALLSTAVLVATVTPEGISCLID